MDAVVYEDSHELFHTLPLKKKKMAQNPLFEVWAGIYEQF